MPGKVSIDFETRSPVNLPQCGVYPYAENKETEILCCVWESFPGGGMQHIYSKGDPAPLSLINRVLNGDEVNAFNASFERAIWNRTAKRFGWPELPARQMMCSYARANAVSVSGKLEEVAAGLGLEIQKDTEGAQTMKLMSTPKARKPDGEPIYNWSPELQMRLEQYCGVDVAVEQALDRVLPQLTPHERDIFILDAEMNDRGVRVDSQLISAAIALSAEAQGRVNSRVYELSRGEVMTVGAATTMDRWLAERGVNMPTLRKFDVDGMLRNDIPEDAREMLELRRAGAKTSTKKFDAMKRYTCADGRIRGLFVYHGAGTGRWTGRGPQLQNLPRPTLDPEPFIDLILRRDLNTIDMLANPLDVLSSSVRSAILASPCNELIGCDFASIEARVLAWIAGEYELLRAFEKRIDAYKLFATTIYGCTLDQVTKLQRQVAKSAVLGLGYQMGAANFINYCAQNGVFIDAEFSQQVVDAYRAKNSRVRALWYALEEAAVDACFIRPGAVIHVQSINPAVRSLISFQLGRTAWGKTALVMNLPSGRRLWFHRPHRDDEGNLMVLDFVKGRWYPRRLYGGLLTENLVQAVSRDLLADAMLRAERAKLPVVLTVHDELVVDAPAGTDEREVERLMCILPEWARGLPIAAEAWRGKRYRK